MRLAVRPAGLRSRAETDRKEWMSDASKGLRLYNTLTRTKEDFVPIDPHNVRMYVCGPTVYDFAHIGNARPVIVFDVLFRLLRHLYGADHVTYVRNITDVDDKINARALRDFGARSRGKLSLNEAIRRVTEKTADQFHKDVAALGCLPPTFEPRATEFVQPRADGKADMITLDSTSDRTRPCLCRGRRSSVRHRVDAGLRPAVEAQSRRAAGRRPRRRRRAQEEPAAISCCGSCPRRKSRAGTARGAGAGPAGTSNARPCRPPISARSSTSMAAGST